MEQEKAHPDDVVKLLADLAAQHGYRLVGVELVARKPFGAALPHHSYKII